MPVLVAASLFDVLDVVAGVGLTIRKATRALLVLTLFEAAVTITTIGVLTAHHGALGAMWGVLASRAIATVAKCVVSMRYYPAPYEFGRWIGMLLLAGAGFAGAQALPAMPLWASAAIKIAILGTFAALSAWLFLDLRRGIELLRATPAPSPKANPPA
jgi:O-antigen/teichoic acid export membrane protein